MQAMFDTPGAMARNGSQASGWDRAFSAAILGLWAAVTIWLRWNAWAEDLSAIYIAGRLWQDGQADLIYAAPPGFFGGPPPEWQSAREALGIADRASFPYVYPPLWAALTAPLAKAVSAQDFANAATLIQVPLLAFCVALAGRIARPARMPFWVWTLLGVAILSLSIDIFLAIWHNQPSILVAFLVLLAFERLQAGRPILAGAMLALAAAIKLTPAIFVLIFLMDRQWRAIASFALFGTALALASIALAGWPLHQVFLEQLGTVSRAGLIHTVNVSVRSLALAIHALAEATPSLDLSQRIIVIEDVPAWIGPASSITLTALAALLMIATAQSDSCARRFLALFGLSILVPLFGPLGWMHYYIIPALLIPALPAIAPWRATFLVVAAWAFGASHILHALDLPAIAYVALRCALWLAVFAVLIMAARARRQGARQQGLR
ncbi:uncharacterized protein DUF2029 [Albidovulum inexpectatum]|uniref:Uncharacterized protein DUF2029 n=2 Tax=Albidovulum inexpectatum TaxID=196587 RepID=A0A2S5JEM4_9RHOB|nr:uncharacterized protein DUF2029 [Albidovulum inexpectatum]